MIESLGLSPLLSLAKDAKKQFEYWRMYKGKRIRIRRERYERREADSAFQIGIEEPKGAILIISYVIEGTVNEVMSVPPGFMLTDVIEYVEIPEVHPPDAVVPPQGSPRGSQRVRTAKKKFFSFESIEQIEILAEDDDEE